ncbi:unnamed protein product [Tenebrio molitor]|nr:unnamed protein product [Tenebrio molitor]
MLTTNEIREKKVLKSFFTRVESNIHMSVVDKSRFVFLQAKLTNTINAKMISCCVLE